MVSSAKQAHIERELVYYHGMFACEFLSRAMDEIDVCNADETHASDYFG